MFRKLLFSVIFCAPVLCKFDDNALGYCVVDADSPGIFISDGRGKNSSYAVLSSQYVDTTVTLNFTKIQTQNQTWKVMSSIEKNNFNNSFVLDERWERFPTNQNGDEDFLQILKTEEANVDFSIRIYDDRSSEVLNKKRWYHFKFANNVFSYSENTENVTFIEDVLSYYLSHATNLWKLHKYFYLHTTRESSEDIYKKSENCRQMLGGCLSIFVATCNNCQITLRVKDLQTGIYRPFSIIGDQKWKKENFRLGPMTDCMVVTVTTKIINVTMVPKTFWAIGDIGYLSVNQSCGKNKRRIAVNDTTVSCENALNETINIFPSVSLLNLLYLLILVPIILLLCCVIYAKKGGRRKICVQFVNHICRFCGKHGTTDRKSTVYETIYNDGWPKISTEEYLDYIRKVFQPSCEELETQFSHIPTGSSKKYQEGLKVENNSQKQAESPCLRDKNRVKLKRNLFGHAEYLNASYISVFNNDKEYIVTQSPLENTVEDFWRLVWHHNICHIVMISSMKENYFCYWPNLKNNIFQYEQIKIFLEEVENRDFYVYRKLRLERKGITRYVQHLHHDSWSRDEDLVSLSKRFVPFVTHLLKIPHYLSPVLVHSKQGVGRTGTVILCDIALRAVPMTGKINMYGITKGLRKSRANMVVNSDQYKLAHLIVKDVLFVEL
ncbi:receptor-type tyrosine-protein phosphatase alpha-like isoform X1 [Tenebrio molitor]|uniref:receptor-type tyrosine-protein phosphatase alpha-like isoform X1 n=2 Tax=Tenebrio molitor TaxID=7067 RepID=UPI0036249D47